jgi:hypothetical protein
MLKPIDMFWLRGQEMTMDEFFTHVAWPGHLHTFEEAKPVLESPLAKDVPGSPSGIRRMDMIGAVALEYKATTETNADSQIADGADNGKYWYRQTIARRATKLNRATVISSAPHSSCFRRSTSSSNGSASCAIPSSPW